MPDYVITIEEKPTPDAVRLLGEQLYAYNVSKTGMEGQSISVLLRDGQHRVVGGTHGWTAFGWLHIDVLWLRKDARGRGWGTRLLHSAEVEAVRRGCRYAELETFSFQALGFYQKNGYQVFGELGNVAGDHRWYFLRKDLC